MSERGLTRTSRTAFQRACGRDLSHITMQDVRDPGFPTLLFVGSAKRSVISVWSSADGQTRTSSRMRACEYERKVGRSPRMMLIMRRSVIRYGWMLKNIWRMPYTETCAIHRAVRIFWIVKGRAAPAGRVVGVPAASDAIREAFHASRTEGSGGCRCLGRVGGGGGAGGCSGVWAG